MAIVKIYIDGNKINIEAGLLTGDSLLSISGVTGIQQLLLERESDIDIPILKTDFLIIDGDERFSIGDGSPPIEENPCLRKPIHFILNGNEIEHENALVRPKITGAELKSLDPHSDPTDGLFADLDDLADEPIRGDMRILVQDEDKFITTPCGNVGDSPLPQGIISDHYQQVLDSYPYAKLQKWGDQFLLILPNTALPDDWSPRSVDLLILIPNGYPVAALDMFFVDPAVKIADGRQPDRGNHYETFFEKNWQRFSWHYQNHKWDPSHDTMSSHIRFCLKRFSLKK